MYQIFKVYMSRSNSRSNSMELEFTVWGEDELPRNRTKSRSVSIDSIETIYLTNSNNTLNNDQKVISTKSSIDVKNGNIRRKRDIDMDQLYHDPTPTPESFLEKIKHIIV